jgi:tetratricopeptide (TPR) repeat protein
LPRPVTTAAPLILATSLALAAAADTITLTNGRVIEADRAWFEGNEVRYQKDGGIYGVPKSLVAHVDAHTSPAQSSDPDVLKARERLAAADPVEATRLLRVVLGRDPESLPALQTLAEALLALGDARAARDAAQRAVQLDDRNARTRALLGDAYAAMGDRAGAEEQYRRSLLLQRDPAVQRKLEEVAPAPAKASQGAQFRIRYDGGVNEPLGVAVLDVLTRAYEEYANRLGFRPEDPVVVLLMMETGFPEGRVPEWAAGLNDGTIRVPLRGLDRLTPRLTTVLRHELAHSFIAARTGGNCPTWLQEGISQWLEGGDPNREDATVSALARDGRLMPLLTLEAPFQTLAPAEITAAYAESLSAIAHIIRRSGPDGVVRLLAALGDRLPSEEALPTAIALSYPEFQKSWEDYLRGAVRPPARPAPGRGP